MWNGIVHALWGVIVEHRHEYDWKVRPTAHQGLKKLIGDETVAGVFAHRTKVETNKALRAELGKLLRRDEHSIQAGRWIVSEWGGIRRGVAAVEGWIGELSGFNDEAIATFVKQHREHRISSWSKLLAFALPSRHAIYDARTAVALNCALASVEDARRFHMPTSRNKIIRLAQTKLKSAPPQADTTLGYDEYLLFLRAVVEHDLSPSILEAEMALFANAPVVADQFSDPK
jgi:hypothetical protein